jgi:amino acid permease
LLLESQAKLKANSFNEIAYTLLGTKGKIISTILIVAVQLGFQTAFIFFLTSNLYMILRQGLGLDVPMYVIIIVLFVLLSAFTYSRNIHAFAATHIFADFIVVITLTIIMVYGVISLS